MSSCPRNNVKEGEVKEISPLWNGGLKSLDLIVCEERKLVGFLLAWLSSLPSVLMLEIT